MTPPVSFGQPQAGKVYSIGHLELVPIEQASHLMTSLRNGLRELGYVEGKNIVIASRSADGRSERLPDLAAELIRLRVDVIVTGTGTLAALAAKGASSTIPIVFTDVGDPVSSGIVASLGRPGGNITGLTTYGVELTSKRLQFLKEIVPGLSRVALLLNPATPFAAQSLTEAKVAADALHVQLQPIEVRTPGAIERAFDTAISRRSGALVIVQDPLTLSLRNQIVDLAKKSRLPAVYASREFADAGGLVAYGVSFSDLYRRTATFVDKIRKGTKQADLPVEQPTKFELVLNMKTAKALAITIPQSVLLQADSVIE